MKKVILVIVVLAVAGYFANSYLEKKAKRETERAEAKRIGQVTKSAVSAMVSRTDAVDDWQRRLTKGEEVRLGPIFTVELERLWLGNRPILFIGSIKDIATYNESHYKVLVEKSIFNIDYMFGTDLQLSLRSTKQRIDSFLKEHPNLLKGYGVNNGVAVIANVKTIRTTYVHGEEGEREEVKIGEGELVDILFTGDVQF
jgi:hypothetical protein